MTQHGNKGQRRCGRCKVSGSQKTSWRHDRRVFTLENLQFRKRVLRLIITFLGARRVPRGRPSLPRLKARVGGSA